MKLKFTTKLYLAVNFVIILFRTLQVILLTESETAFLKKNFFVVDIIGALLVLFAIAALFSNSYHAVRQPLHINCNGALALLVNIATGLLYIISGAVAMVARHPLWSVVFILSLLAAVFCFLFGASAVANYAFPKIGALAFLFFWMGEFVYSYIFYTERSLRTRTVIETFALCFIVLFFIAFGKILSGVNRDKNFRWMYPLGLIASTLCFASVIPELIARVLGFSEKITESAVSPAALAGAALFISFFTINTFRKNNILHPRKRKMMEQMMNSASDSFENET